MPTLWIFVILSAKYKNANKLLHIVLIATFQVLMFLLRLPDLRQNVCFQLKNSLWPLFS